MGPPTGQRSAVTLNEEKVQRPLKYLTVGFVAVLLVSNIGAMSKPALQRNQEVAANRIAELQPRLKPNSMVSVVHLQDELSEFYYNYPFHPINRSGHLEVYSVLEPGASRIQTWQQDFAGKVTDVGNAGGDVWISQRFLQAHPRPEWIWGEGDDRRISWASLLPFFQQFETGEQVGGDDGFLLLPRTPANEKVIHGQAPPATAGN